MGLPMFGQSRSAPQTGRDILTSYVRFLSLRLDHPILGNVAIGCPQFKRTLLLRTVSVHPRAIFRFFDLHDFIESAVSCCWLLSRVHFTSHQAITVPVQHVWRRAEQRRFSILAPEVSHLVLSRRISDCSDARASWLRLDLACAAMARNAGRRLPDHA